MQHDVFISYSSYDKTIADAICSKLENSHIRCWIAPRDILPGKEYGEAIIEAIIDCRILLLVFSVHANESPQVRREIERAVSKGKVIIPFRIEDILPTKSMEYALSNTHWLDAMTLSFGMTYDYGKEAIILHGGFGRGTEDYRAIASMFLRSPELSDTWIWNGSTWKQLKNNPLTLLNHDLTYCKRINQNIIFGGWNGSQRLDKTYLMNGEDWNLADSENGSGPEARESHSMVYDEKRKEIILFGGLTMKIEFGQFTKANTIALDDTWAWNGSDWSLITEHAQPKPRYKHGFVYDSKRNKTILFGGYDGKEYFQDTWEFSY